MIERTIEFSIRNRLLVVLLAIGVALWGVYCLGRTPIDAIPDLSENQVIVFADWMGRSPKEVEDQITYPVSVSLQGLAGVKAVRSTSEFGFSMVNVIFEDGIDFYFARTRVLERLEIASTLLPPGVVPYLAQDATALGQIFWYTVEGEGYDLGELRAIQDWYVRYQLNAVPGVAQVASVGGFLREYQIDVDPQKLRAYSISLGEIFGAVARSNSSVGGNVIQKGRSEYLVRGFGWIRSLGEIESIVVAERSGVPIYVRNLAAVQLGPEPRRAVLEKGGREAVGGVVLMRYGENPLAVTERIKRKIAEIAPGLPEGVRIVPFYERTRLIRSAVQTLTGTLVEEMIVVSIVVFLVLSHVRSALVILTALPLAVLVAFVFMYYLEIPSNIMSLSGIAISIGVLVDAGIVTTENAFTRLQEKFGDNKVTGDTREVVLQACKAVGRPLFFSLMIMLVSFIPVFTLTGMEGKMFRPLAFTKSFALVGVSLLAITLVPALIPTFVRGRLRHEHRNWLVRSVADVYRPVLLWLLSRPRWVLYFFVLLLALGVHLYPKIGHEFMPALDEGSILDMPVTIPSISVAQAGEDLALRDRLIGALPEVESVVGKAGRADTATDPSPPDMIETVVNLRPRALWPRRKVEYGRVLEAAQALVGREKELANDVAMDAASRFDAEMRELSLRRLREAEPELARVIARGLAGDVADFVARSGAAARPIGEAAREKAAGVIEQRFASRLLEAPAVADIAEAASAAAEILADEHLLARSERLFVEKEDLLGAVLAPLRTIAGGERPSLFARLLDTLEKRRERLLEERVKRLDREIQDRAPQALAAAVREAAEARGLHAAAPGGAPPRRFVLERKSKDDLVKELDSIVQVPGWGNIWTQPIINRVNMLATGVRSDVGVKVFGSDLEKIQAVANEVAALLRTIPGAVDVFPDQIVGENYLEVTIDREKAARYGISVGEIQDTIEVALGGKRITTTIEGRRRFGVRVRYAREYREDEERVRRILVGGSRSAGMGGAPAVAGSKVGGGMASEAAPFSADMGARAAAPVQVPLGQLADVRIVPGPTMIRSENGLLRAYVQLNVRDRDMVGFVEEAERAVAEKVKLPEGMFIEWSGQFENQLHAKRTLEIVLPVVVFVIFLILFLTYQDLADALLMMLAVPGAVVGGLIFQHLFGFRFTVAVWVGYIACFGLAAETGIVMLVYLREAIERRGGLEKILSVRTLDEAIVEGAVHRLRPKLLTEGATIIGLVPMLWATGTGAEIMRPMAAPVLGGILVADEVIDVFIPVIFRWVRLRRWRRMHGAAATSLTGAAGAAPAAASGRAQA